ncbi:MAG: hypothetical protein QGF68_08990 [Nitrospinota bacterium]|nr:hypothetical protein [Nitrospinota bacterium]
MKNRPGVRRDGVSTTTRKSAGPFDFIANFLSAIGYPSKEKTVEMTQIQGFSWIIRGLEGCWRAQDSARERPVFSAKSTVYLSRGGLTRRSDEKSFDGASTLHRFPEWADPLLDFDFVTPCNGQWVRNPN